MSLRNDFLYSILQFTMDFDTLKIYSSFWWKTNKTVCWIVHLHGVPSVLGGVKHFTQFLWAWSFSLFLPLFWKKFHPQHPVDSILTIRKEKQWYWSQFYFTSVTWYFMRVWKPYRNQLVSAFITDQLGWIVDDELIPISLNNL